MENYTRDEKNIYNTDDATQPRPDIYDDNSPLNYVEEYEKIQRQTHEAPNHKPKRRKKSKFKKILAKLLLLLVGLVCAALLVGWLLSFTLPAKTTFLIMATDQDGTRTDTLMYGVFDKKDKDITLVSIPRDTYVTVSDDTYDLMNEEYPQPGSKSMKINSVHHFGGEKYGTDMLLEQVESLLDTKIDFYAKINFKAFRYIIDSVGGIDFYVPQNMEYHDPLQNLNISLYEGQQHLNGEQAEQLVRYRSGYANADLGRVDVQQQFMKAFISQTLSKGTILSNPMTFVNLILDKQYIDTNVNVFDIVSYAFVIGGIDTANIETNTLPGKAAYARGQSVYKLDETKTYELLESIMQ